MIPLGLTFPHDMLHRFLNAGLIPVSGCTYLGPSRMLSSRYRLPYAPARFCYCLECQDSFPGFSTITLSPLLYSRITHVHICSRFGVIHCSTSFALLRQNDLA